MDREERWMRWGVMVGALLAGALLVLVASGCATARGGGVGAQSANEVKIKEHVEHAEGVDTFEMTINTRGDAAAQNTLEYNGEAEAGKSPWRLGVNTASQAENAAAITMAGGYAKFLEKVPDTFGGLVDAIGVINSDPATDAAPGLRDFIIRTLVERFLGSLGGGVIP